MHEDREIQCSQGKAEDVGQSQGIVGSLSCEEERGLRSSGNIFEQKTFAERSQERKGIELPPDDTAPRDEFERD